jgi:hypothetical protein
LEPKECAFPEKVGRVFSGKQRDLFSRPTMNEKGEKDERPATIRLDNDLYRRVATVAVEENRSVSGQIRDFIEKGLQARERVAA